MKLTIELVPKTSWYSNVRSNVSKEEWDKIKKQCYKKSGYKCEICSDIGEKWPVECHEIWEYNDKKHIQTLNGLIALCPNCHKVKHVGFAQLNDEIDIVINQLMRVNNISQKEAIKYIEKSFHIWLERSNYDWEINISYLNDYLNKVGLNTSNIIRINNKKMKWYFHENSDNFFPETEGYDFGMENEFIHEIGDYVNGGVDELRELLQKINHYLKNYENLEKLITDDIEQY